MLGIFNSSKATEELCVQIIMLADEAIIVVDKDDNIMLVNRAAEKIFDYNASELMGKPAYLLVPESVRSENQRVVEDFVQEGSYRRRLNDKGHVLLGRRKNGEEFHTQTTLMRLTYDKRRAIAFIIRDITEDKKTEEELLKLASTDPLTGAFNRREFSSLAEREAKRSRRYDRPLSIMMLDLDHFKDLNDTHGHAAGDKALQRFTTICCNALRNIDIFGRWGGEEFVALLPETSAENAAVIAERLRKLVSETEIDFNGEKLKFTVSIGVAQFRSNEHALENPLARADAAVYDAKKAGRNNIAIYQD
ncbi:MAG: GGDEF domain-containing protein [Pseudomonadota bacterium]